MVSKCPLKFQARKKRERMPFTMKAKSFPEVPGRYRHIFHWPRLGHSASFSSKRIWKIPQILVVYENKHLFLTYGHVVHLRFCWAWLGSSGLAHRAVCVSMSARRIFLFWHGLTANGRYTGSRKITQMHLESLLRSWTVTLHLPNKLPDPLQHKLGKDVYSAYSSGKCYKVTYQKV